MTSTLIDPATRAYRTVNPATGEVSQEFATLTDDESEALLERAHVAYRSWRATPVAGRARLFARGGPPVTSSGRSPSGVVRSWTVIHRSFLHGFDGDLPFLLVDVELAEQSELRMIGRLLDGPDAPVRIGSPVTAAFEDLADGVSVPAFTLSEGTS